MADNNYGGRFDQVSDPNRRAYMEQQYTAAGSPSGGWAADMSGYDPTKNYTQTTSSTTPSSGLGSFEDFTSGLESPMSLEDIRAREAREREQRRIAAEAMFAPQIRRQEELGEMQVSSGKGVTGQSMGFNISTAEVAFIDNLQQKADQRVQEIEKAKSAYISSGDLAAADRADKAIQQLNDYNNQLIMAKMDYALKKFGVEQEQTKLNLTQFAQLAEIPEGMSWTAPDGQTYTGLGGDSVDAFFKGSDIVSLMKTLKAGEEQVLTDPNTGTTYAIKGLASNDPNVGVISSYDDQGNLTITRYDKTTGQVLGQTIGGQVGKTKTGPSMVSVNYPRQTQQYIYDANNKQIGYAWSNPITKEVTYQDMAGNAMENIPEGGRVGSVTSFSSGDDVSLENLVNF